jgi:type IV pilus assembly protein PilC
MPNYIWLGIDHTGKKTTGINYANNYEQLKIYLIKQNILVLRAIIEKNNKIKPKYLAVFIEQLAILINANVSLIDSLNIIAQDEKNKILKNFILLCKNSISSGKSLSQTLSQYYSDNNKILCNLINVGEQSGTLDIVLNELADYFIKSNLQKQKIMRALLYPSVILISMIIVIAILLLFVIPQFKTMYDSLGAQLPIYTQFIINCGIFLQNNYIYTLSCVFCLIISIKFFLWYSINFRRYIADIILRLPIIGKIFIYNIIAQLTKTIGLSFKSGIPLLEAINLSIGVINHWRYQLAMQNIANSITNGEAFSNSLEKQKIFPQKVIQLVALGEETGTLDKMLEKVASIYNNKLNNIIDNLNNLLEPIIMLVLGVLVGGLVIGMYLPIFRLGMII